MTDLYEDQDARDIAALAQSVAPQASFSELIAAAQSGGENVVRLEDVDEDGYYYLDDKNKLVGRDFIVTRVKRINSSYGDAVEVSVVTAKNKRVRFVDFSTGVMRQCLIILGAGDETPDNFIMPVPGGLVRSDYQGPVGPATTYYLSTQTADMNEL